MHHDNNERKTVMKTNRNDRENPTTPTYESESSYYKYQVLDTNWNCINFLAYLSSEVELRAVRYNAIAVKTRPRRNAFLRTIQPRVKV